MGDDKKPKKAKKEPPYWTSLPKIHLPVAMDFCSPQAEVFTRVSRFFDELRNGKLMTTKCKGCGALNWPPRVMCPECNSDELEWVELPQTGRLWAFTEMRLGAPMGFEKETPFSIGIVTLDEVDLRILTRIEDPYDKLDFELPMEMFVAELPGDRVIYRFRTKG
jgi:uncharacterized OB-fold protein